MTERSSYTPWLCRLLVAWVLAGCAASPKVTESSRGPASVGEGEHLPSVSHHAYEEIDSYGSETAGFGLYTYVLLPKKPALGSDVARRYKALIAQLRTLDHSSSALSAVANSNTLDLKSFNLFVLPGGDDDESRIVSLQLFDHLRSASGDRADRLFPLERPGPFLVTVAKRVSDLSGDTRILVADLSTTHPDAFGEVVRTYSERLQVESSDPEDRFTSLRLSLLNFIMSANENLSLVKVALAAW